MTIKRTLGTIVLASALALGVSGCTDGSRYHYNGKIGEEKVSFYEADMLNDNILEVTRVDGTIVRYSDIDDDLKLDYVDITKDGETTRYRRNVIGRKVVEEGQLQFNGYLTKILELKKAKGLSDISKE
ncbi:hypothetical protein JXB28_05080 [Candidatus Woesearchaeota archaeon]|nr:hypothetical protein [Candidatus Woesearchaeota archaeon]